MRRAVLAVLMLAGCSGSEGDPLVEYPPASSDPGTDPAPERGSPTPDPPVDAGRDAPEPIVGKKLLSSNVMLEGATTDGHLVMFEDADLKVWPDGASAPITLQKDFAFGFDSRLVRGPLVATWIGEDVAMPPLSYWTKASGVQTIAGETYRDAVFPRTGAPEFAYLVKGSTALKRNIRVTKPGAGPGTTLVTNLDLGYPNDACRSTMAFVGSELLVAGCPNGGSTPRVAVYPLDGSAPRTLLEGSAPGVWVNNARTRALVQTASASSIRPVSGLGANVALDGPIRQATYSKDDAWVVYRDATGKVKRAKTTAPASPVELASAALTILHVSPDARFIVIATKGDASKASTDVVVLDASAPAAPPRTLADDSAASFGLSSDGTRLVYIAPRALSLAGPLYVVELPSGAPQKVSDGAERVVFAGDIVYFQEFVKASKSNVLKAVRVATPQNVITIDQGLDTLTARAMVVGKRLFVGSKVGLWEYPALTP
jgi:hypothetical protein